MAYLLLYEPVWAMGIDVAEDCWCCDYYWPKAGVPAKSNAEKTISRLAQKTWKIINYFFVFVFFLFRAGDLKKDELIILYSTDGY